MSDRTVVFLKLQITPDPLDLYGTYDLMAVCRRKRKGGAQA